MGITCSCSFVLDRFISYHYYFRKWLYDAEGGRTKFQLSVFIMLHQQFETALEGSNLLNSSAWASPNHRYSIEQRFQIVGRECVIPSPANVREFQAALSKVSYTDNALCCPRGKVVRRLLSREGGFMRPYHIALLNAREHAALVCNPDRCRVGCPVHPIQNPRPAAAAHNLVEAIIDTVIIKWKHLPSPCPLFNRLGADNFEYVVYTPNLTTLDSLPE